jgi:hypothetical protein
MNISLRNFHSRPVYVACLRSVIYCSRYRRKDEAGNTNQSDHLANLAGGRNFLSCKPAAIG